jgi:endonuclease YncB( thermonuclease family)
VSLNPGAVRARCAIAGAMLYLIILFLAACAAAAQPAGVIDGDSPELAGDDIRLIGIDAPEGRQLC